MGSRELFSLGDEVGDGLLKRDNPLTQSKTRVSTYPEQNEGIYLPRAKRGYLLTQSKTKQPTHAEQNEQTHKCNNDMIRSTTSLLSQRTPIFNTHPYF